MVQGAGKRWASHIGQTKTKKQEQRKIDNGGSSHKQLSCLSTHYETLYETLN